MHRYMDRYPKETSAIPIITVLRIAAVLIPPVLTTIEIANRRC